MDDEYNIPSASLDALTWPGRDVAPTPNTFLFRGREAGGLHRQSSDQSQNWPCPTIPQPTNHVDSSTELQIHSREKKEELLGWRYELLLAWFENKGRSITESDFLCLSSLIDVPMTSIRSAIENIEHTRLPKPTQTDTYLPHGDLMASSSTEEDRPCLFADMDDDPFNDVLQEPSRAFSSTASSRSACDPVEFSISTDVATFNSFNATLPSLWDSRMTPSLIDTGLDFRDPLVSGHTISAALHSASLKCIDTDIEARQKKGCGRIDQSNAQRGDVPCTLTCGRIFRSVCDRDRHEETVFPQKYWVCYKCVDPPSLSRKELFIRLDKIQAHNRKYHNGELRIDICRIRRFPRVIPEICGLCQYRYRSSNDRNNHTTKCHSGHPSIERGRRDAQKIINYEAPYSQHIEEHDTVIDVHGNSAASSLLNISEIDSSHTGHVAEIAEQRILGNCVKSQMHHNDLWTNSHLANLSTVLLEPLRAGPSSLQDAYPLAVQWLPFTENKGGYGKVIMVEIAYDHLRRCASKPRGFAVKQSTHFEAFQREKKVLAHFSQTKPKPAMVECYGTFEHIDRTGQLTYNLLLEAAKGDLAHYWSKTSAPTAFADIAHFYSKLFDIAHALHQLHHCGTETQTEMPTKTRMGEQYSHGRHGDINPGNILWYSDHEDQSNENHNSLGVLKIADFGQSDIWRFNEVDVPARKVRRGTRMYEPPELDWKDLLSSGDMKAVQSTDIWSFGCTLSLAATWMIKGFEEIRRFQNLRQAAHYRSGRMRSACFHTGTALLPEVLHWHQYLKRSIPVADKITGPMLDLVEQSLLQIDPKSRLTASELYGQLMHIHQNALVAAMDSPSPDSLTMPHIASSASLCDDAAADTVLSDFDFDSFDIPCDFRDSAIDVETWTSHELGDSLRNDT